jgi:hypothetical protein
MSEIKCSTVKITQKGISELNGNREFNFIPRIKINSLFLCCMDVELNAP